MTDSKDTALDNPYQAQRLARQAKWFTLSKIGIALIALLTQFLLVRHMSVEDYAGYTIFIGAIAVLVFFTLYGIDRVVYRYVPVLRNEGRWREISYLMLGLAVVRQLSIALLLVLAWYGLRPFLPGDFIAYLQGIPVQCVVYAFALGCTDCFPMFCNALGKQGQQSMILMFATCLRMLLLLFALFSFGHLNLSQVASVMAGVEVFLALALLVVLVREMLMLRAKAKASAAGPAPALAFGFRLPELVRQSLSTQMAYMVALPFRGTFLKLLVGLVGSPTVIASFGFFQTMADRAYQFMPMFLMKGMLEPALVNDYAQHKNFERIRLVVSLLLRINALIIGMALAVLAGCGKELIELMTNGRYGNEGWLAALILLQLMAMTIGEALWFSLNPIGRIAFHNKLWTIFAVLGYGLLQLALWQRAPLALVVIACLPYLAVYVWLRYVSREACMQQGFGLPRTLRLLPAGVACALLAKAVLLLGPYLSLAPGTLAAHGISLLAAALGMLVFVLVLRVCALFETGEIEAVSQFSPKLARLLRLFA